MRVRHDTSLVSLIGVYSFGFEHLTLLVERRNLLFGGAEIAVERTYKRRLKITCTSHIAVVTTRLKIGFENRIHY